MYKYFDLEAGEKCRDKAHADEQYRAGHRIKVYHDGKPLIEWIPGSNDYYMFDTGKRRLVKHDERKQLNLMTGKEGRLMEFYRTCLDCGAALDPGEICDCQGADELEGSLREGDGDG